MLDDIGADAIKTGMLATGEIDALAAALTPGAVPAVVDPVMVAKGGASLLDPAAVAAEALHHRSRGRSSCWNSRLEAEKLAAMTIRTVDDMEHAAASLRPGLRGGVADRRPPRYSVVTDVLATSLGVQRFRLERVTTKHTHGNGCTLASAIAIGLAQGMEIEAAVDRAVWMCAV